MRATPKAVMAGLDLAIHVWRAICLATILVVMTGCTAERAIATRSTCPPVGEGYYWPVEAKPGFYARALARMNEPSLFCGDQSVESYRFLWLHVWARPVAVRVSRTASGVELEAVELSGSGGYDPGAVAQRVKRQLSDAEWQEMQQMLIRADFWRLPTKSERIGADGAVWVVEGRRANGYHSVDRWWPDDANYIALGRLFMRLSGLPFLGDGFP